MRKLADIIASHPKSILRVFLVLMLAAIYPALQIHTDFNLENFFPQHDPAIKKYQQLEHEFGRDDNTIMVGFKSDSLFSRNVLTDLRAITDSAAKIPAIVGIKSLWSARNISNRNRQLNFKPYLLKDNLRRPSLDSVKQALVHDPMAKGFLLNKSANVTAFYLQIKPEKNNYTDREKIIHELNNVLAPYQQKYDFKISGIPYYRNKYVDYLNKEMYFYVVLGSVLILLLLWTLYRSFSGLIIPISLVWLTILFSLAIMQFTGGYFEVMTSTLAPILLCVGIADSIHMMSKYDDARLQGASQQASIKEMIVTLGSATFLTSITTAIGFGTLMTSEIKPMQHFGLYTAIGILTAFIVTILVLPSILSAFNINYVFKHEKTRIAIFFRYLLGFVSRFNERHYKKITIGFFLVSIIIGSGLFLLKVNGKIFDELSEQTKPIRQAQFFERNLTPPFPMEFIINTGQKNGVKSPVFLHKMTKFRHFLISYDEVARVISLNTFIKKMNATLAPQQSKVDSIPNSRALISQYLLLYEMNSEDALSRVTDFNYQKARLSARVFDVGSYRINQIHHDIDNYLDHHFKHNKVTVTGSAILNANLNSKIVHSLFSSIALAFLLISVLMAMLFKSVRMMLISLIPNILPLIITAGIMGFGGIDIKSSTAVIFTIAFGIAVDDSIHYMARMRVEMSRGKTLLEALPYTTRLTGKPIIITSLILLAGFGTLLTSVFTSTVYMGMLVGITVFTALLADLFLLPSLFYWLRPELNFGSKEDPQPDPRFVDEPDQQAALQQS